MKSSQSILELLTSAALGVVPAPGRRPWTHGWAYSDYRHSDSAALEGREGPVTLNDDGISAFEEAATRLLKEQRVRARWDPEWFWGTLASMVVTASEEDNPSYFIDSNVEALRSVGPTLTIQLIANVAWNQPPIMLGNTVIGNADMSFIDLVNQAAGRRSRVSNDLAERWLNKEISPRATSGDDVKPVAVACWTVGQGHLAEDQTERQLKTIVDLTILLEHDLRANHVYHRGETNRPGIRGLTLDRGAVEHGLKNSARVELAASPLTVSPLGVGGGHSWFSAEPLPLGILLAQQYLREAVESCLKDNPISNRVRVAARWFAEAHYTLNDDDAILALGVAIDAMLNGQRALPGSAMADRFALLEPDPSKRRGLIAKYLNFYGARSSVAHGGKTSKLDEPGFVDEYRESVHWAAWRSLGLRDEFKVSSEKDVDALYDDLRLGARSWKVPQGQTCPQPKQIEPVTQPHGIPSPRNP